MVRFCPKCRSYIPERLDYCPRCSARRESFKLQQLRPEELTAKDVLKGFPSPDLRRYQKETIEKIGNAFASGKKCVILAAPTGFGKSYVNAAFCAVMRSFYATPQLALIDQMLRDPFLKSRFVDIKGRQNYRCYYQPQRGVHVGKCETQGFECRERFEVCQYWIQKMQALNAHSVLLSFAYLVAEGQTEGLTETYLGSRTLLVLDEAHNIEEQCLNHVSVRVTPFSIPYQVYNRFLPRLRDVRKDSQLKELLSDLERNLEAALEQMNRVASTSGLSVEQGEDKKTIERYLSTYRLYKSSKSEWVWQIENDQLLLQPVFGKEFMKELVWKRGEYYIISSATILDPKEFADFVGLRVFLNEDEIEFIDAPSTFPAENRPIIDATVGPLSKQQWARNMPSAMRAVEEILRKETGNVAIHCHSYEHQRALIENLSEDLKPRLIVHSGRNRGEKLREWMTSRGKVFVSVAFSEGQDWKYDICDAQILLKVPFPDLSDKRVKRRLDLGYRKWYDNQATLEVIQAYGRAIRAEDDKARFYIVDGSFQRLVRNCRPYIPEWFREALPSSLAS